MLVAFSLSACTTGSSAIFDTARMVTGNSAAIKNLSGATAPGHSTLRVTVDDRIVLLVLGYTETLAGEATEVWYSAEGEVVRLQNGRVIGTAGLTTDWRRVRFFGLPAWMEVGSVASDYQRERDVMPGYRISVREKLSLREIAPPSRSRLVDLDPAQLRWFEETVISPVVPGEELPASRYALKKIGSTHQAPAQPVYGEHCLSRTLCLYWQRLPVWLKTPT